MILGETEAIIAKHGGNGTGYDDFLFFGKKKDKEEKREKRVRTEEEKLERKQKFWKGVDTKVKESGGLSGMSKSVGTFMDVFGNKGKSSPASDYQLNYGNTHGDKEHSLKLPIIIFAVTATLGIVVWQLAKKARVSQSVAV